MHLKDLSKKTVLVLGAGKTGLASALFLINKARKILLSDSNPPDEDYKEKINNLVNLGVEAEFNKHSNEFLNQADLVITSPGISPYSEVIKKISSINIPVISDIELAKNFISKPIIAVTGTNGKTTTCSIIAYCINTLGKKAVLCGNIGKPLIEVITEKDNGTDYYVLEISSFQIHYSPTLSPEISVCLNITPDHLDWHKDFNHYVETKKKLFSNLNINSWAILNYNDKLVRNFQTKGNKFYFSLFSDINDKTKNNENLAFYKDGNLMTKHKNKIEEIIHASKLKIIGNHNIENALASIAVLKIINLKNEDIKNGLMDFPGVEHRLEFTKRVSGKDFYNDSKATNPEATVKAIEAVSQFKSKKVTLIVGGRDKNTSLNEMINAIKKNVSEVILFGEAKKRFMDELIKSSYNNLKQANNLNEVIKLSCESSGDIILFSPACASFDMFKNYEERGKVFKELVSKL